MKRKLLTKEELSEIKAHVRYYLHERRVMGTFWDFYKAVEQALEEIDFHRLRKFTPYERRQILKKRKHDH
jgi:hypothetical protein